jgi:hypothetical protein
MMARKSSAPIQAAKRLQLRMRLWPHTNNEDLWTGYTRDFAVIPKAMPLILSIVDDLARGGSVSSTYLGLWCRKYDEGFVTLATPQEMAFSAGLVGQRAERTWKLRLQTLSELGFIDLKEEPVTHECHALIPDPCWVIKDHFKRGTIGLRSKKYYALIDPGG